MQRESYIKLQAALPEEKETTNKKLEDEKADNDLTVGCMQHIKRNKKMDIEDLSPHQQVRFETGEKIIYGK